MNPNRLPMSHEWWQSEMDRISKIKTFEDAVICLEMDLDKVREDLKLLSEVSYSNKRIIAIYKLEIICKALNNGWTPKQMYHDDFGHTRICLPNVKPYSLKSAKRMAEKHGWKLGPTLKSKGRVFQLVLIPFWDNAVGKPKAASFDSSLKFPIGAILYEPVANYAAEAFAKEYFEAFYSHSLGEFEWCD